MRFGREEPADNPDESIVEWIERPTSASDQLLVVCVPGFLDAGRAVALSIEHLMTVCDSRLLATFDIDLLFDYRGRRPLMTFESDHFSDIDLPGLTLHELTDEAGRKFLLLAGDEPDTGWMTVVDEIIGMIEDLDVNLTVSLQGFPFRTPHTRPIHITAHATDNHLIPGRVAWVGNVQVPGSLASYLELQLGQEGYNAVGFAAHVPEYLAGGEHPGSALALLRDLINTTGLNIPLAELELETERVNQQWTAQLEDNSEGRNLVKALEETYDQLVAQFDSAPVSSSAVPNKDEIAEQIEAFRAELEAWGQEQE